MEQVALFVPADQLTFSGFMPDKYYLEFVPQPNTSKYPVVMSHVQLDVGKLVFVTGQAPIKKLAVDTMYEVAFEVMFTDNATAWNNVKMTLELVVPGGTPNPQKQTRTQYLTANASTDKLVWREMLAGDFVRCQDMNPNGNLEFKLTIDTNSASIKNFGLCIMGVSVRRVPKYPLMPLPTTAYLESENHWHLDATKLLAHRCWEQDFWKWNLVSDGSNTYFPELQLMGIDWLEVTGKFDAKSLSMTSTYEVALVIKLDSNAEGWNQNPVTLKLNDQESSETLNISDYKDYKELTIGQITPSSDTKANGIQFSVLETKSGKPKSGLRIKAAKLKKV